MPIRNCSFKILGNGVCRPVLPVEIVNPHTSKSYKTYGIIDTGADECAIPADIALLLGHNLQEGKKKSMRTANGETAAYAHTTKFEIFHPHTGEHLYTVHDTPIDFMPNLHVVLLGVNNFLSRFVLTIDYPQMVFSITAPDASLDPSPSPF